MAAVGEVLLEPESGWKRYDSFNSNFLYSGTWANAYSSKVYNGGDKYTLEAQAKVSFKFKGTKLRIISDSNYEHSKNIQVIVDGQSDSFSAYSSSYKSILVSYEKSGLTSDIHTVELINLEAGKYFCFNAIDIDETGEIISPISNGKVLLRITMNDSSEREYKVTQTEVDNFIKWINGTGRTGDNCYKFSDIIDESTEYLIFEKIISFKVLELK